MSLVELSTITDLLEQTFYETVSERVGILLLK